LISEDKNGIFSEISGAVSGALDSNSDRAQKHADLYYESVRSMTADILNISENTGFAVEEIKRIKEHIFIKEHDLGNTEKQRFDTDYDIAQSWQRLIDGRSIEAHDIILLRHELLEIELMEQGYSQQEAHDITNLAFNYRRALRERAGL